MERKTDCNNSLPIVYKLCKNIMNTSNDTNNSILDVFGIEVDQPVPDIPTRVTETEDQKNITVLEPENDLLPRI